MSGDDLILRGRAARESEKEGVVVEVVGGEGPGLGHGDLVLACRGTLHGEDAFAGGELVAHGGGRPTDVDSPRRKKERGDAGEAPAADGKTADRKREGIVDRHGGVRSGAALQIGHAERDLKHVGGNRSDVGLDGAVSGRGGLQGRFNDDIVFVESGEGRGGTHGDDIESGGKPVGRGRSPDPFDALWRVPVEPTFPMATRASFADAKVGIPNPRKAPQMNRMKAFMMRSRVGRQGGLSNPEGPPGEARA